MTFVPKSWPFDWYWGVCCTPTGLSTAVAAARYSICEGTLQLLQQELPCSAVAADSTFVVPLQLLQGAVATSSQRNLYVYCKYTFSAISTTMILWYPQSYMHTQIALNFYIFSFFWLLLSILIECFHNTELFIHRYILVDLLIEFSLKSCKLSDWCTC